MAQETHDHGMQQGMQQGLERRLVEGRTEGQALAKAESVLAILDARGLLVARGGMRA